MSKNSTTAVEIAENAKLPTVTLHNGVPTVSSLEIADIFGKKHKHVLEAIDKLEIPEDFCKPNFRLTSISVQQPKGGTRKSKAFNITQDGFTVLAMGFTGKKAMEFKLAYIAEFNRMREEIQQPQISLDDVKKLIEESNNLKRPVGRPKLTTESTSETYSNAYLAESLNISSRNLNRLLTNIGIIIRKPNGTIRLNKEYFDYGIETGSAINNYEKNTIQWTETGYNTIYEKYRYFDKFNSFIKCCYKENRFLEFLELYAEQGRETAQKQLAEEMKNEK